MSEADSTRRLEDSKGFELDEKHWLIRFASVADLTVTYEWDAELSVDSLLIGALQGLRDGLTGRPKVSDFKRLITAHEEARRILKERRAL